LRCGNRLLLCRVIVLLPPPPQQAITQGKDEPLYKIYWKICKNSHLQRALLPRAREEIGNVKRQGSQYYREDALISTLLVLPYTMSANAIRLYTNHALTLRRSSFLRQTLLCYTLIQ
jgi:hypothetical protein